MQLKLDQSLSWKYGHRKSLVVSAARFVPIEWVPLMRCVSSQEWITWNRSISCIVIWPLEISCWHRFIKRKYRISVYHELCAPEIIITKPVEVANGQLSGTLPRAAITVHFHMRAMCGRLVSHCGKCIHLVSHHMMTRLARMSSNGLRTATDCPNRTPARRMCTI